MVLMLSLRPLCRVPPYECFMVVVVVVAVVVVVSVSVVLAVVDLCSVVVAFDFEHSKGPPGKHSPL